MRMGPGAAAPSGQGMVSPRAPRARRALAPRAVAVAGAAAMLVAGCGTARAVGPGGSTRPVATSVDGVAAGTPGAARAYDSALLRRLQVPGAQVIHPRPAPSSLTPPLSAGTRDTVRAGEVLQVPRSVPALRHLLTLHPPAGMTAEGTGTVCQIPRSLPGTGTGGPERTQAPSPALSRRGVACPFRIMPQGPGPVVIPGDHGAGRVSADPGPVTTLSWAPRSVPGWMYGAMVSAAMTPDSGGAMVGVAAEVTWFPPRTAAEQLTAASVRQVTLAVTGANPPAATKRRVLTSAAAIRRLTTLLDRLRAAPAGLVMGCPAEWATYVASFQPRHGEPVVVASPGCARDTVTIGGASQPALWDPSSSLSTAIGELLGVSPGSHAGGATPGLPRGRNRGTPVTR